MDEPTIESVSIPTVTLTPGYEGPKGNSDSSALIRLSQPETDLFAVLRQAAATAPTCEVRVAGGWVRDKILGLESHDVDIAVSNMTGVQFAELVQKQNTSGIQMKMGVISANPAQSKHLETATMKVCGLDVDFCNLRTNETYTGDSRIPDVSIGTAAEDAMRRDFTCNALFYNLKSRLVEDWTGKGMSDLRNCILRTPLEPSTTFVDDPLRVLRAIRFAVRYDFKMEAALEKACLLAHIHKALHLKVSRERVGKELEGMLSGRNSNPVAALRMIGSLKLADSVFPLPVAGVSCAEISGAIHTTHYTEHHDSAEAKHIREMGWEESLQLLKVLPAVAAAHISKSKTKVDDRLLPVTAYLLPFRTLTCTELKNSNKAFNAVTYIFKEGIKFKTKDINAVTCLVKTVDRFVGLLGATDFSRLDAGLLLRDAKSLWVTALLLATILQCRTAATAQSSLQQEPVAQCVAAYRKIVGMGLDECWTMRPLLDGKEVIRLLDLPRGPAVGTYLQEQVGWMLEHPNGTRSECEAHLRIVKQKNEQQENEANEHVSKKMHVEA